MEEKGVNKILLSDIPLHVFEAFYRKNLKPEDKCNEYPEYLAEYRGLKKSTYE